MYDNNCCLNSLLLSGNFPRLSEVKLTHNSAESLLTKLSNNSSNQARS